MFVVCIYFCGTFGVRPSPNGGAVAKLNWDTDGLIKFTVEKKIVLHRFTRETYKLTDLDMKGLINIKNIKVVQNYSETNVALKEIGKKWSFNIGGIFRNQAAKVTNPAEDGVGRRRVSSKGTQLKALQDIDEANEMPPSPVLSPV